MAATNVGAQDWQRAVIASGKLLATVASGTHTVDVSLPPNCQTLVVAINANTAGVQVDVIGLTSSIQYPGVLRSFESTLGADNLYFFTVLPQLDASVSVYMNATPGSPWHVFAMNSLDIVDVAQLEVLTHITNFGPGDPALAVAGYDGANYELLATDSHGRLVPLVPTATTGTVVNVVAGVALLAAPASGHNYLFGVEVVNTAAAAALVDIYVGASNVSQVEVPATSTVAVGLDGYATTAAVDISGPVTTSVTLRYAAGP